MNLEPATQPTFYFIGVTTGKSSIMKVFPEWAKHFQLGDAIIKGMDFPPHDSPENYRRAVEFLKNDPLSLGALVTTHKLDLFAACRDLFDYIDPLAELLSETSCLSKRGNTFSCHAKDPITSGLTLDGFLPEQHFSNSQGELFCIGAGGSALAITWYLMQKQRGDDRPGAIHISDISASRLDHIRQFHQSLDSDIPISYHQVSGEEDNNGILAALPDASLVINATGLGKDAPGSPLANTPQFPTNGLVWELNYRGELVFLDQARSAQSARNLKIEDGWTYFIHGWAQVIAEVFDIEMPTRGAGFEAVSKLAIDSTGAQR